MIDSDREINQTLLKTNCCELIDMEVGEAGVEVMEEGCMTPTHDDYQIPAARMPPPPPKKKRCSYGRKKGREPPKNGFFKPPDLERFFTMIQRREACA
ncbi:hypothetical protein Ancab_011602 [Ancistrocladus abbreviatus]